MSLHLVTGGSGYFGFVMVEALVREGHQVRIFDLLPPPRAIAGVEFVQGDIREPAAVVRAMKGVDVVHHNVAVVPLGKDTELFWSVNRDGTQVMLDAAAAEKVRKIIYMSSSAIFGAPDVLPVTEATMPAPGEAYGQAKLAGERLCQHRHDLDITIIRPRTIIGPGRLGIMQIVFEWIRAGRNLPVLDGGSSTYQFVHGDDLASACLLAMDRPGSAVYNIGAERFGTLRETLEGLVAHAGSGSRVVSLPSRPMVPLMKVANRLGASPLGAYHALMYHRSLWFDVSLPKAELGWSAEHDNVKSFADAYDWYLANRDDVLHGAHRSHHRSPVKQGVLQLISRVL